MKTITMKGQTNHDFDLIIAGNSEGSVRPLFATSNDEYSQVTGRDGATHTPGGLNNDVFTVNFFKRNSSNAQWQQDRRSIAGWLHSKEEVRIEVDDEPGVHYIGKVTTPDIPKKYSSAVSFSVEFTVHPFRYSDVIETELPDGTTSINNTGNYETPYELSVTVQNSASSYTFSIGDADLTYNDSLRNGDVVTINTNTLEFRLNDELKVLEVEGAFELLQPGNNTITSTISGLHVLTYQERFI